MFCDSEATRDAISLRPAVSAEFFGFHLRFASQTPNHSLLSVLLLSSKYVIYYIS